MREIALVIAAAPDLSDAAAALLVAMATLDSRDPAWTGPVVDLRDPVLATAPPERRNAP